jgi:hypothetical protein
MALKETKEKPLAETTSRRKATRGKHVALHKYWKGIAATFVDKAQRRQYLNMMLDATQSEVEAKLAKRKDKKEQGATE